MIDQILDIIGLDHLKAPQRHQNTKPMETITTPQKEDIELSNDDLKVLKDIVIVLNELPGNKLEFGFNDEARMGTISVFERENHTLIREFPSKQFFSRLAYFRDNILPGLIMDEKV